MLKKLELAWKAIWLAVVCAVVRLIGGSSAPVAWRSDRARVLFLRPDRIGDAIVSTGVFREIVMAAPNITFDVLCSPRNVDVLAGDPHIDSLHVFDRRRWRSYPAVIRKLRACRYDAVIDCMVTAPSMTGLLLMLASGARHRIGIGGRGVDDALTVRVERNRDGKHIIDLLAAFGPLFGAEIAATDWSPRLYVPDEDLERARAKWEESGDAEGAVRTLVNVSAGRPARNWPEERFAAAISHIRKHYGAVCLVVGAPSEWDRVQSVAELAGVSAVQTPHLRDAIALVATATFVLTPDTSVAHMASALAKPAVVMYLEGTSTLWGLYGAPGINLESPGPSLSSLPLETVLSAVDRVLPTTVGTA